MSPNPNGIKRKNGIVLFWIISWFLLSNLFVLYRFVGMNWAEQIFPLTPKEWFILFIQSSIIGLVGGTLFGLLDVWVRNTRYFHRLKFGEVVLIKSGIYLSIGLIALFIGFNTAARLNGYSGEDALIRTTQFFSSLYLLVIVIYLFINMAFLNFILQINDKFGPGNFLPIFLGRYHNPIEEDRIFVFMDLKSSTTYAEILGHIRYSRLIQDCFFDITKVVEEYQAEIYQYVGDEIVLSWKMNDRSNFQNAAYSYFAFKSTIQKRSAYYLKKYGFLPEFKAGINVGRVTAAEVGVIKKEIAYHGDAINTASRIQEQCNAYDRLILCSESFIQNLNGTKDFKFEIIGEVVLKGKRKPVRIYGLEINDPGMQFH